MEWSREISSGFPEKDDLEPEGLRERIVAEISDHLQLAYEWEVVRAGSEEQAIRNVYKRFGDPASVARRLWFEEMKGRFMLQKITVGMMGIIVLGICFVFYFLQSQMNAQADATQKMLHSQEQQFKMLEEIKKYTTKLTRHENFTIKLKGTPKDSANPPMFYVNVTNSTKPEPIFQRIPLGGEFDLGLLDQGTCYYYIKSPWGDKTSGSKSTGPGLNQLVEIDCPADRFKRHNVKLSIDALFKTLIDQFDKEGNDETKEPAFLIVMRDSMSNMVEYGGRKWERSGNGEPYYSMLFTSNNLVNNAEFAEGALINVLYVNYIRCPKNLDGYIEADYWQGKESNTSCFLSKYNKRSSFDLIDKYAIRSRIQKYDEAAITGKLLHQYLSEKEREYNGTGEQFIPLQTFKVTNEEEQLVELIAPEIFKMLIQNKVE